MQSQWIDFIMMLFNSVFQVLLGWYLGKKNDVSRAAKIILGTLSIILITALFGAFGIHEQQVLNEKIDTLTSTLNELTNTVSEKDSQIGELQQETEEFKTADNSTKGSTKTGILLSSLTYTSERHFEVSEASRKDILGETYGSGHMVLSAEGEESYGKVDFSLNRQYTTLSNMTIAVSKNSYTNEDFELTGWIGIYDKENNRQIYKSPELSVFTKAFTVPDLDISNVDWLEIRYYDLQGRWSLATDYVSLEIILDGAIVR